MFFLVKFLKSTDLIQSRVIRTCGYKRAPYECYHADNDHHLETVCQCFEDGCNSAANLSMFSVITTCIISFAMFLVKF